MEGQKSPEARDKELSAERAKLIGDAIKANPYLVQAVEDSPSLDESDLVSAREYFEQRWPSKGTKPT